MRSLQVKTLVAAGIAMSLAVLAAPGPAAEAGPPDRPTRVLIVILDQARPDTIERYNMRNVRALMRDGVNFPKAIVGHMAAETVISHGVITSGQLPKNLGWSNEVHRDTDGVLGAPGEYYITSSLGCDQFRALIDAGGYKKLPDYLRDAFGEGSKFVSIAQKRTAACTAGHTSSAAGDGTGTNAEDIILQIRGGSAPSCDGRPGWRRPEDGNNSAPRTSASMRSATAGGPGRPPTRTRPEPSSRHGSTTSTATGSSPASTRRTSAGTSGRPTPPSP